MYHRPFVLYNIAFVTKHELSGSRNSSLMPSWPCQINTFLRCTKCVCKKRKTLSMRNKPRVNTAWSSLALLLSFLYQMKTDMTELAAWLGCASTSSRRYFYSEAAWYLWGRGEANCWDDGSKKNETLKTTRHVLAVLQPATTIPTYSCQLQVLVPLAPNSKSQKSTVTLYTILQ